MEWFHRTLIAACEAVVAGREAEIVGSCDLFLIDNEHETSDIQPLSDCVAGLLETNDIKYYMRSGHGNIGFGRSHNMAIRASKSDVHLVLNPDCVIARDALINGLRTLHNHPDCVLLTPAGIDEHGEFTPMAFRFPRVRTLAIRALKLHRFFKAQMDHYEYRGELKKLQPVVRASGAFMLMQTQVLQAIGAFDEHFFLHFEDIDLSLRMARYGSILYDPSVRVIHRGGRASGAKGHNRHLLRSALTFYNLHGWLKHKERK
jgi:GT2 family glycosyltransferase